MAIWIIPSFIEDGPIFSLTTQMPCQENLHAFYRISSVESDQFLTYNEAIRIFKKIYTALRNFTRAAP